jgi:THO complex subunit 4
VNDDFEEDFEGDDFEEEQEEEQEEEYDEAPVRSLQTKSARAALSTGTSVQVSNLHADVTEEDMHELFTTAISGDAPVSIKSTCVNYDKNGKCNGTATITFVRRVDAMAAIKEYNGVPLDGQPMSLDIVGGQAAAQPVRSRPQFVQRSEPDYYQPRSTFQRDKGRSKGKGKGGKGKGRGRREDREDQPSVTEADLDDGLDSYFKDE